MGGFIYIGAITLFILLIISFLIKSKHAKYDYNILFNLITVMGFIGAMLISLIEIGGFSGFTIAAWAGTMLIASIISTILNAIYNAIQQRKRTAIQV